VFDWLQLNTDAKKVEKICEGKVPGPNRDLQDFIAQHDTSENLLTSTKHNQAILSGNYGNRKELNSQALPLFTGHHCQKQKKHCQYLFPKLKRKRAIKCI